MIVFLTGNVKSIYFLITIDTECDKDIHWRIQKPLTFRSILEGIPNRLTPFFQAHSLTPTYLLSPEVIQDDGCCRVLERIPNCELGTHLHGEFIEPMSDLSTDSTDIPPCGYSSAIEKAKLENLTKLFHNRFGYPPKSFRAGRFGLSKHTLRHLSTLGYVADSSVTPFRILDFPSGNVNYWGSPVYAYRPHNSSLIEIPVSTSIPALQKFPPSLVKLLGHTGSFRKPILQRLSLLTEPVWVRPFRDDPQALVRSAFSILENWPINRPAFINVMFHSVEVIPGASPYAADESQVQILFESVHMLMERLSERWEILPVTMSEMA